LVIFFRQTGTALRGGLPPIDRTEVQPTNNIELFILGGFVTKNHAPKVGWIRWKDCHSPLNFTFKSYPAPYLSATGRQYAAVILPRSGSLHKKPSPAQETAFLLLAACDTKILQPRRREFAYGLHPFSEVIIFALGSPNEISESYEGLHIS
jgi:hypothetical protein